MNNKCMGPCLPYCSSRNKLLILIIGILIGFLICFYFIHKNNKNNKNNKNMIK